MYRQSRGSFLWLFFLALVILPYQNCSVISAGDTDEDLAQLASLSDQAQLQAKAMSVLNSKCVSCHNNSNAQGGIDYINDVNALLFYRLVKPVDAAQSDLFMTISEGRMPPAPKPPLTSAEAKAISDWIQDGLTDVAANPPPGGGNPAGCTTLEPKYSCIRTKIILVKCASCHTTQSSKGVNLNTYQSTMNVVVAGSPSTSKFYTSVLNDAMPTGSNKLTAQEKTAIMQWIQSGAPNN